MVRFSQPRPHGLPDIDYAQPLSRGLLWCQVGHTATDGIQHRPPALAASGSDKAQRGSGGGVDADWLSYRGATALTETVKFESDRLRRELARDNKWTIFFLWRSASSSAGSAAVMTLPYADSSWSAPFATLGIRRNGGNDGWQVLSGSSGSFEAISYTTGTPAFIDQDWHTICFTRNSSAHAAYKNGVLEDTQTGAFSGPPTSGTGANDALLLGNPVSDATQGDIAFFGIWGRALSPAEIQALHKNPYQVLKPVISPLEYIFTDAGGATLLSFSPSATGTNSLSSTSTFVESFSNSGVGTLGLTKVSDFVRSFSQSATGSSDLSRGLFQSFSQSATGTASLAFGLAFLKTFTYSATGGSSNSLELTLGFNLANSGTGTSNLGGLDISKAPFEHLAHGGFGLTGKTLSAVRSSSAQGTGTLSTDPDFQGVLSGSHSGTGTVGFSFVEIPASTPSTGGTPRKGIFSVLGKLGKRN